MPRLKRVDWTRFETHRLDGKATQGGDAARQFFQILEKPCERHASARMLIAAVEVVTDGVPANIAVGARLVVIVEHPGSPSRRIR